MLNPQEIEECYLEYTKDLITHLPDGIFDVDLSLLQELGLLSYEDELDEETMNYSFYVIESHEKLTLFNNKFLVWIIPKIVDQVPHTYTLIALNECPKPHLEMGFTTKGAYNHSGLILRILESFLKEIEENEEALFRFKEST